MRSALLKLNSLIIEKISTQRATEKTQRTTENLCGPLRLLRGSLCSFYISVKRLVLRILTFSIVNCCELSIAAFASFI